jgi:hypothetical protein
MRYIRENCFTYEKKNEIKVKAIICKVINIQLNFNYFLQTTKRKIHYSPFNNKKKKMTTETLNESSDMDSLVEKIYSRVMDLARHKHMFYNSETSRYDLEPVHYSSTNHQDTQFNLDGYLSHPNEYNIFKHTCLVCVKTFDSAKYLLKHFITVHVGQAPSYQCKVPDCVQNTAHIDLDQYVRHFSELHLNSKDLPSSFAHFYEIFILKCIRDMITQYMMLGQFYMERSLFNKLNTLQLGRENTNLNDKLVLRVYENLFQAETSVRLTLRSSSFKSNLLFNSLSQVDILNDIKSYLDLNLNMSELFPNNSTANSEKFFQCKLCLKLFDTFSDAQVHFSRYHTYNTTTNKVVSCPYCNQVIKSNCLEVNVLSLLNKHVSGVKNQSQITECTAVRTQSMNLFNPFLVAERAFNNFSNDDELQENGVVDCLDEAEINGPNVSNEDIEEHSDVSEQVNGESHVNNEVVFKTEAI